MKTDNVLASKGGEARETRAEKAIRLLTTTTSSPFNQKLAEFKAFYPAILIAIQNGLKTKQIIKILTEGGLKTYPALFDKLMAAMGGDQDVARCRECGQELQNATVCASTSPQSSTDTTVLGPASRETGEN